MDEVPIWRASCASYPSKGGTSWSHVTASARTDVHQLVVPFKVQPEITISIIAEALRSDSMMETVEDDVSLLEQVKHSLSDSEHLRLMEICRTTLKPQLIFEDFSRSGLEAHFAECDVYSILTENLLSFCSSGRVEGFDARCTKYRVLTSENGEYLGSYTLLVTGRGASSSNKSKSFILCF